MVRDYFRVSDIIDSLLLYLYSLLSGAIYLWVTDNYFTIFSNKALTLYLVSSMFILDSSLNIVGFRVLILSFFHKIILLYANLIKH